MNLTYGADIKYARLVCDRVGLGLKIDGKYTTPCTDGNYIMLPPLDPMWGKSSAEYRDWWYALLHESFHNIHHSDFAMMKDKKIDMQSFMGMLLNITLDFKIETCSRGEFVGRDRLVHQARYAFAADKIYRMLGTGPATDELSAIADAVWTMDSIARIPWIPEYKNDNIPGKLSPLGGEKLALLLSSPTLLTNYMQQKTSEDSWAVLEEMMAVLKLDPNDPKNKGDGIKLKGDQPPEGMGWRKFSEMAVHDHSESNRDAGMHIEFDTKQGGDWVPMDMHHLDLDVPFPERIRDNALSHKLDKLFASVRLSKRIRRELQSMTRTRVVTNKRRGRVHKRALYKTAADANAKVFKQRDVMFSPKSTAVMLLQDWSGSMGSTKFPAASTATHELGRVLKALQVNFAIYGFSTQGAVNNLLMKMKGFKETFNTEQYTHRCVNASHHMHSNADGDFILWAAEQLMKQKASRKILFVLSDGSPAAHDKHGNHDAMSFTQRVVRELENMGHIEIYAIGIMDKNVDLIYRNRCTIDRTDELEGKLLGVLRNKILAGMMS